MIFWRNAARTAQLLTVVLVSSLVVGALPFAPAQPAAAAPGVGQTYFTPFEAQDFIDTLRAIQPGGTCCTGPVVSTISLTSSANGNTVVYDHFEDGYEADPSSPVQASTVTLSLDAGDVWTQTSNVPVDGPGRGAGNFFDGRDKIVATRPIAVVQAAYSTTPGTLHAGAVSAYDINKFGRRFDIPVGENANYNNVFDHVGAIIIGSQPGTTVRVDADNDGTFESSFAIGAGETAVVNSGMSLGARVEADKPVGVYVSTGDNSATYEGRFFELFPTETWASSYVTPVGSQDGSTGGTRAFLYNPGLDPVTVNRTGGGGSTGTILLAPQGTGSYLLPINQGALFASSDGSPFYVVQLVTTESTSTSAYDWGFTLVPSDVLAPSFVVPYGPGSAGLTRNYSPVWVSALANTTLFIDLDGDPSTGTPDANGWGYDFTCAVSAFQSWTIYDDGTNTCIRPDQSSNTTAGPKDLTGARIYTNDGTKLTGAWGQRPNYTGGAPALDMGTTIFPNPAVEVLKDSSLKNDLDGDGELDPGETITYTITATNYGIVDVLSVVVTDETPVNTSYVPGSTTINGSGTPDDAGPFSPSPLDLNSPSSGLPIGAVLVDGTVTVTFDVVVDDPLPFGVLSVENAAVMSTSVGLFTATDSTLLDGEPLQIRKTSVPSSTPLQGGDSVDYTIQVFNADTVPQTLLVVNDALPTGTTYRPGSAAADIDGTGIPVSAPPTFVSGETLQPGELLTITFTVDVDGPISAGVTDYTNVATAQSDQRGPTSAQVTDPGDPQADLAVTKTDSPDPQRAGNQVTYTIQVENLGPDEAASAQVVDTLPAGVTFNATAPGGLCTEAPAGTLTCDLGDLPVGSTFFDVVVDVDAGTAGTITNSATVGSATPDPVPANNTDDEDTLILSPSLVVTKSTSTPVIDSGDTASYSFAVENTGTEGFAFPAALSITDDSCAPVTGPTAGDTNGNSILDPAETWTFTCATALTQDTTNTVTVTATPASGPVVVDTDQAMVDVRPSIAVTKSAGVASVDEPGDVVTFTLTVENTALEDVTIDAIGDSVFGDVLDPGNAAILATTCVAGTAVLPGAGNAYSCTFDANVTGNASGPAHSDTVTVDASDDEGNTVQDADGASVAINDVVPTLTVTKSAGVASISEPGGVVTFTVDVENTSPESVDLTALTDSDFGDLFLAPATTCVPTTISAAAVYSCTFDGVVTGSAGGPDHSNTVTATVEDDDGNAVDGVDTASVVFTDVAPAIVVSKVPSVSDVDEPGGAVSFTVSVENVGVEDVDISAIDDSVFGDVLDPGNGLITGTTCAAVTVAPGAGNVYSCSFSVDLVVSAVDSPHVNTVDVTAEDDEGNVVTESAGASIVINDVVPTLTVTKTPTPGAIDEPGATVSFAITVTNDSTFEAVDLTSLADDVFGDLTAATATTCVLPQVLAPGGSYACSFSGDITETAANSPHQNTVTATGTDDEGSVVTGNVTADVVITDVAPAIVVSKSASPLVVPAVGAPVTFTVSVENTGVEPITLTTLTDDIYGDIADALNPLLDGTTCTLPQAIALSGTYACTFTASPSGAPGASETDTVTAEVIDDEGTTATGADSATVTFGNAEISGLAWLDGLPPTGNGVQDAGEAPVAGLTVELLDDLGTVIAGTTTDGAGGYLFDGLDAGDYRVRVTPPAGGSFVVQDVGGDDTVDSDVDGTGVTALITVVSGEVRDDVDAGVRPASLTDTVWLDLDSDGTRAAGEDGIPGVTVVLLDDLGSVVASTATDASGDYTFEGLAPADYSVRVDYPGAVFSPLGPDSDVDPGGQTPSTFPLASGPNANRGDAGVTPALIGDFVWLDVDADGIQDAGEPGVAGATVQLYDGLGALVQTATTDPVGGYQFAVAPGDYRVALAGAGVSFSPQNAGADDTIDSDVDGAGSTAIFTAPSGVDNDAADAGVLPAGLVDSVWLDVNGDGVQDPGEPGIEGVAVNLYDALGSLLASTTTDPAGQFGFSGLLPGDYEVEVAPVFPGTGFVPAGQGSDPLLDSDVDPASGRVPITTSSGLNTGVADAGVVPGALSDTVWLDLDRDGLRGAGEPGVAGVTINLLDALGAPLASTTTGGSGQYTFTGLLPADYEIEVVAPSGGAFTANDVGPDESIDSDVDPASGRVTVPVASGVTVDESAAGLLPGSIAGTLWFDDDADTAQGPGETGMAGITVQLLDDLGSPVSTAVTIGDGSYVFDGLVPGDYTVRVDAATIGPLTSQTFDLDGLLDDETVVAVGLSDEVTGVDFGYQAPASVGGIVFEDTDGDGLFGPGESPLAGVDVTLTDSVGNVFVVTTAADGGYSSPVQPGPVTADIVESTLPGGVLLTTANEPQAIVAAASTTSTFTPIGYQPFYPVSGEVWGDSNGDGLRDPGEATVSGVSIAGVCAGPDGMLGTGDDVDLGTQTTAGSFTFPAVPAGDCSFAVDTSTLPAGLTLPTFDPDGGDDGIAIVSIPVGGRTDVDFGYQPGTVDLYLTKVSTEGNVQAGDEAEWILTVANIGLAGATGPITVTDDLPDGLSYVSSSGPGWSCSAVGSLVTCVHPGPLPAGGSLELRIVTDVDQDLSGTVNNFAEVTLVGDANVLNNLAFAGVGLLPATGFNLGRVLGWSLLSIVLGMGLVVATRRRGEDQDLVRNS